MLLFQLGDEPKAKESSGFERHIQSDARKLAATLAEYDIDIPTFS